MRYAVICIGACLGLNFGADAQNGRLGVWVGAVHNVYRESAELSARSPYIEPVLGIRYAHNFAPWFRMAFDLGRMNRYVEGIVHARNNPSAVYQTTRASFKSFTFDVTGVFTVAHREKWEVAALFGFAAADAHSVTVDVVTSYGSGSHNTNDGQRQVGYGLLAGGRYARSFVKDMWFYSEAGAMLVFRNEWSWDHNHGPNAQPVLPSRPLQVKFVVGAEFVF